MLSRLQGCLAAVRVITGPRAHQRMLQEMQVFHALSPLQGHDVPVLLSAGPLQGGNSFFTAAKFIEVRGTDLLNRLLFLVPHVVSKNGALVQL